MTEIHEDKWVTSPLTGDSVYHTREDCRRLNAGPKEPRHPTESEMRFHDPKECDVCANTNTDDVDPSVTIRKLSPDDVREIRDRYDKDDPRVSYASLADEYDVTPSTIGDVVNRETYPEL